MKFGYNIERKVKLSPVGYVNQQLLNYTQLFASEADYVFYALPVTQQLKLSSQIEETVKSFLTKDDVYQFMGNITGTTTYTKKFFFEVLAMVKQLILPTFFLH